MKLLVFKSLWEWNGIWQGRLEQTAESGYAGVEYTPPADAKEDRTFRRALDEMNLQYIAQVVTRGPDHITSFREQVLRAADLQPLLINSHSAADRMPAEAQYRFFEEALRLEERIGIPIAHETHRGRAFFTPWQTAAVLRQFPELKLGADFSHWCAVCERMPDAEDEDVHLCLQRSIHIHGRVGYPGGPQISDPRAPEYQEYVNRFIDLWLTICRQRLAAGAPIMTFTPEFGPAPYLQLLPFTGQPVTDLWAVNLWMFQTFEQRYREMLSEDVPVSQP
ncbi:sugar phosphate isomerase/epimerase family protein [Paenibacillus mucilaginosus]|uniref:Xylose isomerase domain-containing protein n=1 Tax=Paenibacillus mucilaginosus (strain KNP414) TaxID=1036673 RepID=F8FQ79_PAEMK|nr:TIM barrel protein [Paenibacillus mucilaginosus]AEI40299.1 xylose isomerase domain-containing protein [Paenibacillus mucilaginosus KNP414]MCG7213341.1 sugar phosphate isomerase/epimerase [Paenibacillus mucilaginosus]WDM29507.1 TIM barrel protein [Paenibacillus mucilaginosus]